MKKLRLATVITLILALLTACSPVTVTPPQDEPTVTVIVDDMNRDISVIKNPQRIVSLAPSTTEILFALGVLDRVVGVTDVCLFPPEAQDIEQVGMFYQPSVETIVSMKPDIVFAASLHKEPVEQLDALGVPVIVLDPQTLADILANIEMVGKAVGADAAAATVIAEIQSIFSEVNAKVATLSIENRPVVFWEVWSDPIWTAGKATFIHELIEMAGGVNMAEDVAGTYVEYSFEMLLAKDPQVIFYGHAVETVEEYLSRPNWGSVSAVKSGRVYLVDQDIVQQPGPRIGLGLLELAKHIHPDLWD